MGVTLEAVIEQDKEFLQPFCEQLGGSEGQFLWGCGCSPGKAFGAQLCNLREG